jgi:hypothetical protein
LAFQEACALFHSREGTSILKYLCQTAFPTMSLVNTYLLMPDPLPAGTTVGLIRLKVVRIVKTDMIPEAGIFDPNPKSHESSTDNGNILNSSFHYALLK